jgi:hypothetical protein
MRATIWACADATDELFIKFFVSLTSYQQSRHKYFTAHWYSNRRMAVVDNAAACSPQTVNEATNRKEQVGDDHRSHSSDVVELPIYGTRTDEELHAIEM